MQLRGRGGETVAFSMDPAALAGSVANTVASFSPLVSIAASMVLAGGVVAWSIGQLKAWRTWR